MFFVNIKSKSKPEFYDNPKNNNLKIIQNRSVIYSWPRLSKSYVLTETKMYLYCIFVQCLVYNLYGAPSHESGPVLSQYNVPVSSHENVPVPLHKNVPAIGYSSCNITV